MAFLTDLITCMSGDTSTNNFADGGIVFEHLPVDFDTNKTWIVFGYSNTGNAGVLGNNNVISNYNLSIQVVSPLAATVLDTANRLTDYLNSYSIDNLISIILSNDSLDLNIEKNVYYKTLNYDVLYVN